MATIFEIVNTDRNLNLFTRGLQLSELENKLGEAGPFTIFGPVNLALDKLAAQEYDRLLQPAGKSKLYLFLSGYIMSGKKMFADFKDGQAFTALNGTTLTVTVSNGDTYINNAKILAKNKQGSNGVIHLLDKTY